MIDADAFDVILPAATTLGEVVVSYAALTMSSRTAGLVCDFVEQQCRTTARDVWNQETDSRTIVAMTDHAPRYYHPQPGFRDIEIELALERVGIDGYAITRWEDRDGRLAVRHGTVQATPFGLVWRGTVFDPTTTSIDQAADQAAPHPPAPRLVGHVETGILPLTLLRHIADGTIALHGREPIV